MKILLTGGTGYIGSHTCVRLIELGYDVVIVDNLSNSDECIVDKIEEITGIKPVFYKANIARTDKMAEILEKEKVDAVMHFAALKSVPESEERQGLYIFNNATATIALCDMMNKYGVKKMILSSSASVYGNGKKEPFKETDAYNPQSIYARTKCLQEEIVKNFSNPNGWSSVILRYFNPVGAHPSGIIGEDPKGIPSNLMPYISRVAVGNLEKLNVYGNDYDTKDGTGVRDYIHIMDIVEGHIKALDKLNDEKVYTYNLGSGNGYSVLEMIESFEKATGVNIPYEIKPRRRGDVDICYADASLAKKELGWKAERTIEDMCLDEYKWISEQK